MGYQEHCFDTDFFCEVTISNSQIGWNLETDEGKYVGCWLVGGGIVILYRSWLNVLGSSLKVHADKYARMI